MTKPLRVLVVHSAYGSGPASGENRVVQDEMRLLRDGGHDVSSCVLPAPAGSRLRLASAGIGATWSPTATREVADLLRTHRPHVLHAHNLFPSLSPAVLLTARARTVPVVMTLHNYRLLCLPGTMLRDARPCEDCLSRLPWRGVMHSCHRGSMASSAAMATSIVLHRGLGTFASVSLYAAVSQFVRDKHLQAGWSASQIVVKPNFAWSTERRRGPGDYFLFLGRLSSEKGVETLLHAMAMVDARCVIAGDGPASRELQTQAPPNVEFTGTVEPKQAIELVRGARALVLPSIWYEAAPRSIVEAYAAGVPVIASRLGALPESVREGVTGLLFSAGNSRDLARAARCLLHNDVSERLGEGAYIEWSRRYTPEKGLEDLESLYQQASKRYGPGRV